jgi:cysteine-rich repeat protein
MRTKTTWLWVLGLCAGPWAAGAGCGDDETQGGGGQGGSTVSVSSSSKATSSSSATTSAGGGEGGGSVTPDDACPGPIVTLAPGGAPVTITGSTTGRNDDYKTYCADVDATTSAPDVVVQLDVTAACSLEVSLTDTGAFDGVISMRHQQCDARLGNDFCYNIATDNEVAREHVAEGTHFVVIDGANGTSGDFSLTISCTAPTCGDGIVNPGEQCDHGPAQPNDGCGDPGAANECQTEAQTAADTCPGTPIPIDGGETLFLPASPPLYNNADAADDYKGGCMPGGEVGGRDEVFAVTPTADGVLTVTVGEDYLGAPYCPAMVPECWANYVYIREGNCTAMTDAACVGYDVNGVSQATLNVNAGTTYYVFVDGLNFDFYSAGPYILRLELQ